jgi:hypothetical protein
MKKSIILSIILAISMATCSTSSIRMTPTNTTMLTIPRETPTLLYIPPAMLTIHSAVVPECSAIIQDLPLSLGEQGRLLIAAEERVYLRDLKTGQISPFIENTKTRGIGAVSPKKDMILVYSYPDSTIQVMNINGQVKAAFPTKFSLVDEKMYTFSYWISEDHILVESVRPGTFIDGGGLELAEIIDPLTGKRHEVTQYPDLFTLDRLDWEPDSRMLYNSTLTRVAYPTRNTINLVNLETGKIMPGQIELRDRGRYPSWSPDGKQLLFVSGVSDWQPQELYVLDENGKITPLTAFSKTHDFVDLAMPAWSVDGRYIAFWLNTVKDKSGYSSARLAVLDIETGKTEEYCMRGKYTHGLSAPVWSSDDKYLLVFMAVSKSPEELALIVDTETKAVYRVHDEWPDGWMR